MLFCCIVQFKVKLLDGSTDGCFKGTGNSGRSEKRKLKVKRLFKIIQRRRECAHLAKKKVVAFVRKIIPCLHISIETTVSNLLVTVNTNTYTVSDLVLTDTVLYPCFFAISSISLLHNCPITNLPFI